MYNASTVPVLQLALSGKKLTEQITSQLMEAGKAAAVAAASSRIEKLSDKLSERSAGLQGGALADELGQALLEIGYTGYVGQEFIPTRDPFHPAH